MHREAILKHSMGSASSMGGGYIQDHPFNKTWGGYVLKLLYLSSSTYAYPLEPLFGCMNLFTVGQKTQMACLHVTHNVISQMDREMDRFSYIYYTVYTQTFDNL